MIEFHKCDELENNHKEITVYYGDRIDKWNLNTGYSTIKNIKACPFCGNKLPTIAEPCRFKSSSIEDDICKFPYCFNKKDIYSKYCRKHRSGCPTNFEKVGITNYHVYDELKERLNNLEQYTGRQSDLSFKNYFKLDERLDKIEKNNKFHFDLAVENYNKLFGQIKKLEDYVFNDHCNVNERLDKLEQKSKFQNERLDHHIDQIHKLETRITKLEEDIESNRDD